MKYMLYGFDEKKKFCLLLGYLLRWFNSFKVLKAKNENVDYLDEKLKEELENIL